MEKLHAISPKVGRRGLYHFFLIYGSRFFIPVAKEPFQEDTTF